MYQSILANISILLFMHLCLQSLYFKKENLSSPKLTVKVLHILITSIAIISMFYMPIFIGEFRFDLRTIPIAFLAVIHGPLLAIPVLFITSIWRFMLGGAGAVPGVLFGLLLPTFITLIYYHFKKKQLTYITGFILFTVMWLVSDLPMIFFIPDGWETFQNIWLVRFISFQLGAFTLFYFINLSYQHIKLVQKLQHHADRDPLTGLYNLRKFSEIVLERQVDSTQYIAMLDIDHFKNINDLNGHQNGDQVLRDLGELLKEHFPDQVLSARYGGEEFILCIQAKHASDAYKFADLVRKKVERFPFCTTDGQRFGQITASIGLALLPTPADLDESIKIADQCLYRAKANGRNCVIADPIGLSETNASANES